jgi:hypothetical protein
MTSSLKITINYSLKLRIYFESKVIKISFEKFIIVDTRPINDSKEKYNQSLSYVYLNSLINEK